MVAAYAWHPGNSSVNSRWGVTVPLLPDEIISSWLVRAALAHGCDPLVLSGDVWSRWRVWALDTDRFMHGGRLKPLSRVSGIPPEAFRAATLYPVASRIHGGNLPEKAVWPWILALGARNTKRRGGLQYCPSCLTTDANPYYRIQWRFAWHTGCERHGCSLLERCWNCGAPVEPHRLMAEDDHAAICATCKMDLRKAKSSPYQLSAMCFQQAADCALHDDRGMCLDAPVSATEWFELADFFVSLIRRASRSGTDALVSLATQIGASLHEGLPAISGTGIEQLRVHERQNILGATWRFLVADKSVVERALKKSGITHQGFCGGGGGQSPALIAELAAVLPYKPITRTRQPKPRLAGPRLRHEVKRMMAKLERKLEMMRR